jgi:hypothetical protein
MQAMDDDASFADGIHFFAKPRHQLAARATEHLAAAFGTGGW